jgi:hypothetical protein
MTSEKPDSPSKILRLDSALWEQVAAAAERSGRSPRQEAESRLRDSLDSLDRGRWAAVEPGLTPRSRALGRLLGFLANEIIAFAPADAENEYLQQGVARILARLSGAELPGREHEAEMMADYWWLRMNNAHERTVKAGEAAPMTDEQKALLEIREELFPQGATSPDGDK